MLTFASGKTSIDLCATALLRWLGHRPTQPDREHDFGALGRRLSNRSVKVSSRQRNWFDAVEGSDDRKKLKGFRDALVHRVVRQDIHCLWWTATGHALDEDFPLQGDGWYR